jgi:ABC-2 type transport system permease protein
MSTTRTTFEMGLREYARTPVLLALLLFLPAYFIFVFTAVMPDQTVPVAIPGEGLVQIAMTELTPVLMTPMATALVGGVAGLFLMQSARDVDGRLAIVGTTVPEILLARGGVLALAAIAASLVSVGVLAITYVPESVAWFLVATVIAGLLYGAIGALIGLVLNRLAGIYLLMFGPLLDIFLAQSPLAKESVAVAEYLPAHYPMQLVFDAAFTASVDLSNLGWALAYLVAVAILVGIAFTRQLRVD